MHAHTLCAEERSAFSGDGDGDVSEEKKEDERDSPGAGGHGESEPGQASVRGLQGLEEPPARLHQAVTEGAGDGQARTLLEALGNFPACFCLMKRSQ